MKEGAAEVRHAPQEEINQHGISLRAFNAELVRIHEEMRMAARTIVGREAHLADDLVQEATARVLKKFDS